MSTIIDRTCYFFYLHSIEIFLNKKSLSLNSQDFDRTQNCPTKLNVQSKHNFGQGIEFYWITVKSTIGRQSSQTTSYFLMQRNNMVYNNKWVHWTGFMCTDKTFNLCTHLELCKHWSLRQDIRNAVHIWHLFHVLRNEFHGWMWDIVVTSYAAQICSEI
jgi:hypothetical protein